MSPAAGRMAALPRRWRISSRWSATSGSTAGRRRVPCRMASICAGDGLSVGAGSRAAVYLIGADTPLRLDENTVSRFEPPPEPGQWHRRADPWRDLFPERGPPNVDHSHALRERRDRRHGGLSAGDRLGPTWGRGNRADRPAGQGRAHAGGAGARRHEPDPVATGERVVVAASGGVERALLPGDGSVRRPAAGCGWPAVVDAVLSRGFGTRRKPATIRASRKRPGYSRRVSWKRRRRCWMDCRGKAPRRPSPIRCARSWRWRAGTWGQPSGWRRRQRARRVALRRRTWPCPMCGKSIWTSTRR